MINGVRVNDLYLSILDQEYYDFCKTILKQKGAL